MCFIWLPRRGVVPALISNAFRLALLYCGQAIYAASSKCFHCIQLHAEFVKSAVRLFNKVSPQETLLQFPIQCVHVSPAGTL